MTAFPRMARRYPSLDRVPESHSFRLIFDGVGDLEITWARTAAPPSGLRRSGLGPLGYPRTKPR